MAFQFSDLKFRPHPSFPSSGVRAVFAAANGYCASVVRFPGSFGFRSGLYEMAIMRNGKVDTNNELFPDDVLGYLTTEDVENFIVQMGQLDPTTGRLPDGVKKYEQKEKMPKQDECKELVTSLLEMSNFLYA